MIRLSRRKFISFIGLGILSSFEKAMAIEKLQLSDSEWQARLSDEEYYILRKEGTERPGTSVLNFEKRKGIYHCVGCEQPLFSSCLLYTSPSPRDRLLSRMPSSA